MSNGSAYWEDCKDYFQNASRDKKQSNKIWSTNYLIKNNISFESKNNGIHLIINGLDCKIDFWPSTGKFITRKGVTGRGLRMLMRTINLSKNLQETRKAIGDEPERG